MSFSSEWLALREPVDFAARDKDLLKQAATLAGPDAIVVDLGSGTGSTARAFSGQPSGSWTWRFVDGDTGLLDIATAQHPGAQSKVMNLRDIDDLPLDGASLICASALLDLMPVSWMVQCAARLRDAAVPFYAALNYDGVMTWSPAQAGDAPVTEAFNAHQQTDKGIGPAMGPHSGAQAASILQDHGFDVLIGNSPWLLGPEQAQLHTELITGIGAAAAEMGCAQASAWRDARHMTIDESSATIGHTDILAIPRKA